MIVIVKIVILPKLIYKFNTLPVKILAVFLKKEEKKYSNRMSKDVFYA